MNHLESSTRVKGRAVECGVRSAEWVSEVESLKSKVRGVSLVCFGLFHFVLGCLQLSAGWIGLDWVRVGRVLTNSSHGYRERVVPGGGELAPAADKVACHYHRDIFSQAGESENRPGRIYECFWGNHNRALNIEWRDGKIARGGFANVFFGHKCPVIARTEVILSLWRQGSRVGRGV